MWSTPVVVLQQFFKRLAGIAQCTEQRFVEALVSQFAVEVFNEAVLLGLSRRDIMSNDTGFLSPFEDRHAGELSAVVRNDCLRHAAFIDDLIQFACNTEARQRRISHQPQVLTTEGINDCQDVKPATVCQRNYTKSKRQIWLGPSGSTIGFLEPKARFLPPLRRTCSFSSRQMRLTFLWFTSKPSREIIT